MGKFQPGQKKLPNAGRKAGTPNKRTQAILELVREYGDPLLVLAAELKNPEYDKRIYAADKLMPYCYPKLTAVQVSNDPENPIGQTHDRLKQELIEVMRKAKEERSK